MTVCATLSNWGLHQMSYSSRNLYMYIYSLIFWGDVFFFMARNGCTIIKHCKQSTKSAFLITLLLIELSEEKKFYLGAG